MCEEGGKLAGDFASMNGESLESAMIIYITSTLQTNRGVYVNVC
jgi:hypothetical protein